MRKFIWLALAIGTAELLKREAHKRGLTLPALLSAVAAGTAARLTAEHPAPSSKS